MLVMVGLDLLWTRALQRPARRDRAVLCVAVGSILAPLVEFRWRRETYFLTPNEPLMNLSTVLGCRLASGS